MRILLLANNDIGLYRFRKELVSRLAEDHDLILSFPPGRFTQAFKELGCRVVDTRVDRRGLNPFADFALFLRYLGLLSRVKPQAVLTYTIKPNIYGGLACRLKGIPQIANITGLGTAVESGGLLSKLILFMHKAGLKKARHVFFQNTRNRDRLVGGGVVTAPSSLIPGSGVNLSENPLEPYPGDDQGVGFLFIGRIMKSKGVGELLKAFGALRKENAAVRLSMAGEPEKDYMDSLNALVDSQVSYLGYRSDIHELIAGCHCVVLPSYHEGMANVLLEAAASGRPVIASRIPGCRETFDEGTSGLGCEPKDADSLQKAMEAFLKIPNGQRRLMGLAGRDKMVREFDRNKVIDAYLEEIEKVWNEKTAS